MPQFMKAIHGQRQKKYWGTFLKKEKMGYILPNYLHNSAKGSVSVTSPKHPIKEEPKAEDQPSTSPKAEKCGWGPNCPFCKNQEEEEDWNGDPQKVQMN